MTNVGEFEILNVAVANGRYFGGGMKVCPQARLADGEFDVTVIKTANPFRMLGASGRIYKGTARRDGQRRDVPRCACRGDAADR